MFLKDQILEDDTGLLQVVEPEETEFRSLRVDKPVITSTWTTFPTEEDPFAKYKFLSFSIERDYDVIKTSRQTYGLLDWLGDLGGLRDALKNILELLLIPLVNKAYKITVASTLFRVRPRKKKS